MCSPKKQHSKALASTCSNNTMQMQILTADVTKCKFTRGSRAQMRAASLKNMHAIDTIEYLHFYDSATFVHHTFITQTCAHLLHVVLHNMLRNDASSI
jgi:hypothetical protein